MTRRRDAQGPRDSLWCPWEQAQKEFRLKSRADLLHSRQRHGVDPEKRREVSGQRAASPRLPSLAPRPSGSCALEHLGPAQFEDQAQGEPCLGRGAVNDLTGLLCLHFVTVLCPGVTARMQGFIN